MTQRRAQVIVVGGGPAGAATAYALARVGVDVLVLDRARFPRAKACSEYMSPQASRLLADMGVLTAVEHAGAATLAGMQVRAPNGTTFHGRFAEVRGYRGYRDRGLALPRTVLDPILLSRARAAGARVCEGVRVAALTFDRHRVSGVEVIDDRGRRSAMAATVVVGADGLRSIVSRRLGVAATKRAQRRIAFVSHFAGVDGMGDSGEMHVERDGYVGLADVGIGLTNVAVVVPMVQAKDAAGNPAAYVNDWIRKRPHLAPRFAHAHRVDAVLATGPFASASVRAWAPGAALVGDAADFFDPFTGEGIYAALRGAELLVPRLQATVAARTARDADALLADYDRARVTEFSGKWAVERIIGTAVSFPSLMNTGARSLSRRPDMAHTIVGVTGDFVPAREVLRPGFLLRLAFPWTSARARPATPVPSPEST